MKLRTSRGLVAIALGTALVLTGCASGNEGGSSPSPTESSSTATDIPEPTAEDIAAVEAIKVTGDVGAEPTVEFEKGLTVSAPTARSLHDGDGDTISKGQQITMHSVAYKGSDGTKLQSTWTEDNPEKLGLDDNLYPQLLDVVVGKKVGTRFVFAAPTSGGTLVTVAEITAVKDLPTRAEGEAVTPAEGLPVVTLDDSGKPSIEIPEGYAEATELVVQPLIKGSGAEVTAESTITAHYTGMTLDGEVFDSSWEKGSPVAFPLTGVIQGWTQGLAGQTVGSQVLLVIPPALGYGAEADPSNPLAGKTLVFVVDILDAS
ncbi:FKBP-type peptidyl-prolyl cis-trans isomerase [Oerskovia turbata]